MESRAEVVIANPQGMHLRPATEFAKAAQATGCAIRVHVGESEADGTSVLELAMMAAGPGTTLVIVARGAGAEDAVRALADLVRNDFRR